MSTLMWDPAWETGIPKIDQQHRLLFDQVDLLFNAVQVNEAGNQIPGLLAFLASYVDAHFRDEEKEMEATHYSELARHRAIHNSLREKVAALVAQFQTDPSVLTIDVLEFLTQWLVDHISVEDRRMALQLKMWASEHPPGQRDAAGQPAEGRGLGV